MKQRPEALCTVILIAANAAVFFILSMFGDTEDAVFMMRHGAMYGYLVTHDHEYYRLFTCLFLHFGIQHLLNNMVILGALGWNLERGDREDPVPFDLFRQRSFWKCGLPDLSRSRPGAYRVSRRVRRGLRSDGRAPLGGHREPRQAGTALGPRHAFYGGAQPLLRTFEQRR